MEPVGLFLSLFFANRGVEFQEPIQDTESSLVCYWDSKGYYECIGGIICDTSGCYSTDTIAEIPPLCDDLDGQCPGDIIINTDSRAKEFIPPDTGGPDQTVGTSTRNSKEYVPGDEGGDPPPCGKDPIRDIIIGGCE